MQSGASLSRGEGYREFEADWNILFTVGAGIQ